MVLGGCENVGYTNSADQPASNINSGANLEAFWCNPEGWADAGIIADFATPDIGYAGIALVWATEDKELTVRRVPTRKTNELGRLVVGPRQSGSQIDVTYIVYKTRSGSVRLRQEPLDLSYEWAGMPRYMECEKTSRKSDANP